LREPQPEQAPRHGSHRDDHESRKAVMYLSVAGMMALIVTLWVLVMPVQLSGLKLGGMKRAVMNPVPVKTAADQWNDLMSGASARLQTTSDAISAKAKIQAAADEAALKPAPIDTAALTAKLQAANATSSAPIPVR